MTPELLQTITDIMGASFNSLKGDADVGTGSGHGELPLPEDAAGGPCDHGVSLAARRIQDAILKTHDFYAIKALLFDSPGHLSKGKNLGAIAGAQFFHFAASVSQQCRIQGTRIQGVGDYSKWHNTGAGGPFNCVLSPLFAELFSLLWPSLPIPPECILSPSKENIASRTVGQPVSLAPGIDPNVSCGYGSVSATFTGAVWSKGGAMVLTLKGLARLPSGELAGNEVFAVSIPAQPAGTIMLAPNTPGARLLSVQEVSPPSGMTSGTVVISGLSGRYYPQYPE